MITGIGGVVSARDTRASNFIKRRLRLAEITAGLPREALKAGVPGGGETVFFSRAPRDTVIRCVVKLVVKFGRGKRETNRRRDLGPIAGVIAVVDYVQ